MVKKMSRTALIALSAALVVSAFSGCGSKETSSGSSDGQGGTDGSSQASVSSENLYTEVETTKDMEGYDFVFASHFPGLYYEPGENFVGDKILARYDDIMENNNCNITIIREASFDDFSNNITSFTAAGMKYADVVLTNMWSYESLVQSEYLQSLSDLENIKMTDSKWQKAYFQMTTEADGKIYGANFMTWSNRLPEFNYIMTFNKTLIAKKGLTDPYDLYDQGKWNWDTFRQMLKDITEDTDGDGVNDIWGLTAYGRCFEMGLMASNGSWPLYKDSNGKIKAGFMDNAAYNALDFCKTLVHTDKTYWDLDSTGVWTDATTNFTAGKVGFTLSGTSLINTPGFYSEMVDEFCVIPLPVGPDYTGDPVVGGELHGDSQVFCITNTADDAEKAAYIFNMITEPLDGEKLDSWKAYAKANYFQNNARSMEFFEQINDNCIYNLAPKLGAATYNAIPINLIDVTRYQTKTAAQAMQEIMPAVQQVLDEGVNAK